jgi:hypothetical protein
MMKMCQEVQVSHAEVPEGMPTYSLLLLIPSPTALRNLGSGEAMDGISDLLPIVSVH